MHFKKKKVFDINQHGLDLRSTGTIYLLKIIVSVEFCLLMACMNKEPDFKYAFLPLSLPSIERKPYEPYILSNAKLKRPKTAYFEFLNQI